MSHNGEIRLLVCCHYFGGGKSMLEAEELLESAVRARGYPGKIISVETRKEIPDGADGAAVVARHTTSLMREQGWGPVIDTFTAALGGFKHSIVVYGAASDSSAVIGLQSDADNP